MRRQLLGQQVVLGYPHLVFQNISRNAYHLHTVAKRRAYGLCVVGRSDEKDFRKVVLGIQIVVVERGVLLGVEHLQKGRCRISVVPLSDLVHLVEYDYRIGRAATLDCLYDTSGHGTDVGTPVSADFGFVVQAAQRDSSEFAFESRSHGFAERSLAHSRRAVETYYRRFQIAFELYDGEVFEDSLLYLVQPEVVLVELLPRTLQVQIVFGGFVPRQIQKQLQICHLHRVFGHRRIQALHFGERLFEHFGHLLVPVLFGGLFAHFLDFLVGAVAAQLVLNRPHLLLQEVVALLTVEFLLDLALNLVFEFEKLLFADEYFEQFASSRQKARSFQKLLTVRIREIHVRAYEIYQPPARVDVLDCESRLLGNRRRSVHDTQRHVPNRVYERTEFDVAVVGRSVFQGGYRCRKVRFGGEVFAYFDFLYSVQYDREIAVGHLQNLDYACGRTYPVHVVRSGLLDFHLFLQYGA